MKYIFLFTFLLATSFAIAQSTVPSIEVKRISGEAVDIQQYLNNADKTYIISFWATWCSPCKKELDAISYMYEEWQDKYNVELIAVSIDTRRTAVKVGPMVASKGWDYTIFCDANNQFMQAMNVQAVPHTFLVNGKGEILWSHSSYMPGDEDELEEQLQTIANQ